MIEYGLGMMQRFALCIYDGLLYRKRGSLQMNRYLMVLTAFAVTGFSQLLFAHTPLLSCTENRNETVTCEGGFSDGSSAAGVDIRIIDEIDRVRLQGTFDQQSRFTFAKPSFDYHVVFDAGSNHVVILFGGEIE